ncbi:uncharacterized protein LOC128234728 isoform X5 [Mya arenaria]|nr:uncharacterized protein LOC128234728 isoform X5 [Mya arenaria]
MATGCNTFGIRESEPNMQCKCADINEVLPGNNCTATTCETQPCGSIDSTTFSIFRVENKTECFGDCGDCAKNKNCLATNSSLKSEAYKWEDCNWSTFSNIACSSYNSTNVRMETSNESKWNNFSLHCFQHVPFPAVDLELENASSNSTNAHHYWTGIAKWPSIVSAYDKLVKCGTRQFGFINKTGDTYSLDFVAENGNTLKKKCLCLQVKKNDDDRTDQGFSGIIAGIAVPAVLLLILILVLCKRRTIANTSKSVDIETIAYDLNHEHPDISKPVFVSTTSNFSASNPTYFVIQNSLETPDVKAEENDHTVNGKSTEIEEKSIDGKHSVDNDAIVASNYESNSLEIDNLTSSQLENTDDRDAEFQLSPPPPPTPPPTPPSACNVVETENPICPRPDIPLPHLIEHAKEQTNDALIETENPSQCSTSYESEKAIELECQVPTQPWNDSEAEKIAEVEMPLHTCSESKADTAVYKTARLIENDINGHLFDSEFDLPPPPTIEEEIEEASDSEFDMPPLPIIEEETEEATDLVVEMQTDYFNTMETKEAKSPEMDIHFPNCSEDGR